MIYELNGKQIRIPDNELEALKPLAETEEERIKIWLEDNEYLSNAEQDSLTKKAAMSKITSTIHQARKNARNKTQKERTKKENPTKEKLIKLIAETLEIEVENLKIENPTKLITFTLNNETFKLDLIQQRKPKSPPN